MSVEKFIVTKQCSGFTVVPNEVLQNLNNLEALGLWVALASRPPGWEFQKQHIQSTFHIGRDKLSKLLSILKAHNLVEIKTTRNKNGYVSGCTIHIKNGSDFIQNTENQGSGKVLNTESQSLGLAAYKRKKEKRKIKSKAFILPEWLPEQDWSDFVKHRKHIRAPLSEDAKKRTIHALEKMKNAGTNISDVITQSIVNGWKGLFPIRNQAFEGSSYANKRKSNAAIHFESGRASLRGTIYDPDFKDPFKQSTN